MSKHICVYYILKHSSTHRLTNLFHFLYTLDNTAGLGLGLMIFGLGLIRVPWPRL